MNLGRVSPYIFLFNFFKIFLNRVIGLLYEQLSDPGAAGSELNSACGEFTKIVDSHSIESFAQVCSLVLLNSKDLLMNFEKELLLFGLK